MHVENHGKDAIDRLGLGLMRLPGSSEGASGSGSPPSSPPAQVVEPNADRIEEPEESREAEEGEGFEDIESDGGEDGLEVQKSPKLPRIKFGAGKRGLRQLFSRRPNLSTTSPSAVEEGRVPSNPNLLAPRGRDNVRAQPKPIPMTAEPERMASPEAGDRGIFLTRTTSAPRTIRFAMDSSQSSDSAPHLSNYGANNPGFKRNPSLAMTRTTSVQSTGSQKEDPQSVSFREPEKRR